MKFDGRSIQEFFESKWAYIRTHPKRFIALVGFLALFFMAVQWQNPTGTSSGTVNNPSSFSQARYSTVSDISASEFYNAADVRSVAYELSGKAIADKFDLKKLTKQQKVDLIAELLE